jgi:hypothetical protein
LETSAIIIGYAMSRLDRRYLTAQNCPSWKEAFRRAGVSLDVPPASFKNLRDEFDPVHGNARRGWHGRPLRANRQRVLGELCDVSDAALLELVARILSRDVEAIQSAVIPLSMPARVIPNVAERLLTGRRAEEHFLAHCEHIVDVARALLVDRRLDACGFDFGVSDRELAIEVKGLKLLRGDILFTDREWSEATGRRDQYVLVVVGNLISKPKVRAIWNPASVLHASCTYRTSIAATWRANVAVT